MRKLFYLLFLLPFLGLAQNATVTPQGTASTVYRYPGGTWAEKLLKTPVIDTATLFPNIANLGRILTYNGRLYHHNGTNYKKLAYASDILVPNLLSVLTAGNTANKDIILTSEHKLRLESGLSTVYAEFNIADNLNIVSSADEFKFNTKNIGRSINGLPFDVAGNIDIEIGGDYVPLEGTTTPITGPLELTELDNNLFISYDTDNKFSFNFTEGGLNFSHSVDNVIDSGVQFQKTEGLISTYDYSEVEPENKLIYAQRQYVDDHAGIPLSGTTTGNPVTGLLEMADASGLISNDGGFYVGNGFSTGGMQFSENGDVLVSAPDNPTFKGIVGDEDFSMNNDGTNRNIYIQEGRLQDYVAAHAGGATNLSSTPSATDYTINNSNGTGAVISGATTTNSGVLIATDKVKLNALSGTNTGDNVQATPSVTGISRLYTGTGSNTNGGVDQNTYTTGLAGKEPIQSGSGVVTKSGTSTTYTPVDTTPTVSSSNLITSGGAYTMFQSYLPLAGGTLSGSLLFNANNTIIIGSVTNAANTVFSGAIRAANYRPLGNGTSMMFQNSAGTTSATVTDARVWTFNNPVTIPNGVAATDAATVGQAVPYTTTATLDFPSTAGQSSSDLTITVTGAIEGKPVILGTPNAAIVANSCFTAWVSATNTVTVRFNNYTGTGQNPASGSFTVNVTK